MKKEEVNKTEEIKKGIITILLFFIFPTIYQLFTYFIVKKRSNLIISIHALIGQIILTIILITIQKDKFNNSWKDFKKNKKEYIDLMVKAWLLGYVLMLVSNLIINLFITKGISANEAGNRETIKRLALYAIPAMTIFAPICEEITFRATTKKIIKNKYIYILFTSLAFAGAHLITNNSSLLDLLYLIPYGSLGAVMAFVYLKTDNILTNIGMHIFHNTLSILILLLL